jgi:hypothetical protein
MTVRLYERHGRPEPGVELLTKRRQKACFLLRDRDVSPCDHNLTVARFHLQKAHLTSMSDGGPVPAAAPRDCFWYRAQCPAPETHDPYELPKRVLPY